MQHAYVVISKKMITFAETSTAGRNTRNGASALWLAKKWLPLQRHQQQTAGLIVHQAVVISKKMITFAETSTAYT